MDKEHMDTQAKCFFILSTPEDGLNVVAEMSACLC